MALNGRRMSQTYRFFVHLTQDMVAATAPESAASDFVDGAERGTSMNIHTRASKASKPPVAHELHFASIYNPGREVVVPCDPLGHVDMDSLTERLKTAYLCARAMVGREYLYPRVELAH